MELTQPESPERLNYVGVAHTSASTLFALAEDATEAIVFHAFHPLMREEGVVPFAVEATISYQRPTRGRLCGVSTLSPEEQTRIRDEIVRTDRVRFPISTRIFDESGTLIVELQSQWGLKKPRVKG